ncbi:MAG: hypothetical protein RBT05_02235 [Bacteroidales bacterium]|nr:hypothetical protein [Bacteroidales bacterium]
MSKYQITNPNNSIVRDCKSRTTGNNKNILLLLISILFFTGCSYDKYSYQYSHIYRDKRVYECGISTRRNKHINNQKSNYKKTQVYLDEKRISDKDTLLNVKYISKKDSVTIFVTYDTISISAKVEKCFCLTSDSIMININTSKNIGNKVQLKQMSYTHHAYMIYKLNDLTPPYHEILFMERNFLGYGISPRIIKETKYFNDFW